MQRFLFAIVVALAVIACTYAETTCENHRRNSRNSAHGLNWNIKCDSNGDYEPLQCTDQPDESKWCACYDKDKQISPPSRHLRHCECKQSKYEAEERNDQCPPQCERDGKFKEKQCCEATGRCRCVNRDTGEASTNTNC